MSNTFFPGNNSDKDWYRILMQTADDRIALYDCCQNLITANDAFYSLLGYSRAEYHNFQENSLIHPDDLRQYNAQWANAIIGKPFVFNVRLRHGDGHWQTFSAKTHYFETTEGTGLYSCIMRDISAMIAIQKEMKRAREEAEAAEKLKSSFLANMSHEIRTPLNGVIGFSRLLCDENLDREQREKYYTFVKERSQSLLSVIDNIVEISQLEIGQIAVKTRKLKLNQLCDQIDGEVKKRYLSESSVQWEMKKGFNDTEDSVRGDAGRLKQVLMNLIDNAFKFTAQGSVSLEYHRKGSGLIFCVTDSGIGIPQEMAQNVFESFKQADDSFTRSYGGSGLGLSICRGLVELMEGEIWVEPDREHGACVCFTIPYRPDFPIAAEEREERQLVLAGKPVLIVEDDFSSAEFLKILLRKYGVKNLLADTGRKALETIRANPDIVLVMMDIQIPEIDGLTVTRTIKKEFPNIPVVAQSAHVSLRDQEDFIAAGCDEYINKPIDPADLDAVLRRVL